MHCGVSLSLISLVGLVSGGAQGHGQTFQELHALTCVWNDTNGWDCTREGVGPQCALAQANDRNFYGTTASGGRWGCGTIFKITPEGQFTTLAHFNGTNGCSPYGALLEVGDGGFYGTTMHGNGSGSFFRFTAAAGITDLLPSPGYYPLGDLALGADGNLYGVARGTYYNGGLIPGTVFVASTNGPLRSLHFFSETQAGLYPSGGLLLASDGYFYGVTSMGGADDKGTVYRIGTNGDFATIASFSGGFGDASWPNGKLVEAPDGSLYGVAEDSSHVGAVFRVTKDGTLTTVAAGMAGVNQYPIGSLVLARDGNFYGCTYEGGDWLLSRGSVFRITPQGTVATLFPFTMYWPPYPGAYPYAGLIEGSDGNLYGTTWQGGAGEAGNIFRVNMPGPKLSASKYVDDLVLSWRTNYTGYTLQWTAEPVRGTWTECSNSISTSGSQHFVTNAISGPQRFFRLSKPSR